MKKFLLHVMTLVLGICGHAYATDWTTSAAGVVTSLSNWTDGTTSPTSFTTPGDTWTITQAMTLSSSSSWIIGDGSSPVTVTFSTGGSLTISGAGSTDSVVIFGHLIMSGGTLSLGGAGTTSFTNVHGNVTVNSGSFGSSGATSLYTLNVFGNYTMIGGTATTASAASGRITMNVHGDFSMRGGTYIAGGAGCTMRLNMYGACSFSGTAAMTNTGAGCTSVVHMSSTSVSMLIDNTSGGTWSGTNVFVDSNSTALLGGNFSTSTGGPAYGLTVNGTLKCPASYHVNGAGIFKLNASGTLKVVHAGGIDSAINTTGTRTFNDTASYGFIGSSAQITSMSLPPSLKAPSKLSIDNVFGVSLSQNTATTGTFEFYSGILKTGAYTMTTPPDATAVTGASATNYVQGTLIKPVTGFTGITYEVGDTDYAPVTIALDATATAGSIGVKSTYGPHPNIGTSGISPTNIANHYWTVTNMGVAGPTTVIPTATYEAADILGGANDLFVTQIYSGTAWLSAPLTTLNVTVPIKSSGPSPGIPLSDLSGDFIFGRASATLNTIALTKDAGLTVYPNPCSGTFTINILSDKQEKADIRIINVAGVLVQQLIATTNSNLNIVLDQPAGMYLIAVSTADEQRSAWLTIK